jgi:lambda family phage tail tape measure protein
MASRSLGTLTLDLIARIGGFQQGMDRASRSVASTGAAADAASVRINALQSQFLSLSSVASRIAGPLAAAFSVNSVYQATEAYSTLTNRLKLVTTGSSELAAAQSAVFGIAQASAQPLSATAELYQRIATNQDALKLSGEGVAGVVGTISKTLAISGASADSANAALTQLGQAFASGVLRGEELNSVMEQAPALSQAIAAGMGKTVGELRAMGAAGELTAEAVVKAIQSQSGAVDALFARTATTIGNSFTKISNSMTRFIGELDQATGASSRVAAEFVGMSQAIDGSLPGSLATLRNNSEALTQVLTTGLYVALGRIAGGLAQQGASALYAATANQALLVSSAATAKGDLWAAQAKQIDAKALLQRANLEITTAAGKVASDRARQSADLAQIRSTEALLASEVALERERLAAQISEQGRIASMARLNGLKQGQIAANKQIEISERALAATTLATSAEIQKAYAMRTAAALAYGETTAVVNAATIASDRAAAASSMTARAFGALTTAGRGLLALMGGPLGLLFITGAVAVSFMDFRSSAEKAAQGLEGLKGPLDDVISKFQQLTRDQKAAALIRWGEAEAEGIKSAGEEYDKLQKMLKTGLVGPRSSASGTAIYQEYSKRIAEVAAAGKDLSPILEELRANTLVDPKVADSLVRQAGALSTAAGAAKEARDRLNALNVEMNKGVSNSTASTQATSGLTAAGEKYLKTLQDGLGKLQDNNDVVKEASRFIAEHKDLSEADRVSIMSAAHASRAQAEANKAATAETKSHTSAVKANQKAFEDAEENYKRQIELINTTTDKQKNATEAEKLAFEVSSGKYIGLSEQRKGELKGLAAELDAKKALLKADEDSKKLAAFSANVDESNQTAKDGFDQELAGAGQGDKRKAQLKEMLAIEQDFNKQQRELVFQRQGDEISQELFEKETAKLSEALAGRLVLQQDYYNQLDASQVDWMAGAGDAWNNYLDQAKDISSQTKDMFSEAFAGMNDSLYNFVTTGKLSFSDMAATFAETALRMLIQWGTAQVAMAALNAFTSTAAIPIVGPFAAPAAAASALGSAGSFMGMISSVAGMAHDGIDSVPQDGTWFLQKGERVTTAETSAKLDRTLEQVSRGGSSSGQGLTVNLIEDKSRAGQTERGRNSDGSEFLNLWAAQIRAGGNDTSDSLESAYGLRRNAT